MCNVACSGKTTTTVTGTVYDPALRNPLYNISVYVPAVPLTPLPAGVPTGSDACSCGALYKSGAIVNTSTAVDGTFTLSNVPVGTSVPLVLQVGKWRKQINIDVKACQPNPQPDKSLGLPSAVAAGDTITSMPDIAVSTGGADTLECLMTRIGLPSTEYVAGTGTTGHVHVFRGGDPGGGGKGGGQIGKQEAASTTLGTEPESDTSLWDTPAHLMPYDIVLLSCEGGETFNAIPANLETYLNAGGRAFGSHYHYSWFSGPNLPGGSNQSYSAPADWGNNLATWSAGSNGLANQTNGKIVQTLNGSTAPFPKGEAFYQWLGLVGALTNNLLPIAQPRYNSVVGPNDKPSQGWINDTTTTNTMYFSFDTPVAGIPGSNPPAYCGRAVFSDLHVDGASSDKSDPPTGCSDADLSPQEKALEFMLFDLSSCVIPDTVAPPDGGGVLQ